MIEPVVFWGVTTEHRADVYVRLATSAVTDDELAMLAAAELGGYVEGPFRADAATLKSRAPLQSLGNDPAPLARAALLDPCFWSPWSPATYVLTIELKNAAAPRTWRRTIGVRPLAARQGSFRWEGRRWVFRGVSARPQSMEQCSELAELRGGLCLTAEDYDDQLGTWATRSATPIALLAGSGDLSGAFAIASHCPAVWTIVAPLEIDQPFNEFKLRYAPNILLGCWDEVGSATPAWANAHWAPVEVLRRLLSPTSRTTTSGAPAARETDWDAGSIPPDMSHGPAYVAVAPAGDQRSFLEQRKMCDALQRECCRIGDLAGYVVGLGAADFLSENDR